MPNLRVAQKRIAEHPARFKVVACGRRWGKTTLGLAMAIRAAKIQGARVWWVAPTYLLAFHPWRAFKSRFAAEWAQKIEEDHHIDLDTGGSITVKTADYPDGLRGVGLDFVVVDEAAFIDEEVWAGCLRPALSDREGSALILSTPRGRNWFYHAYQRGIDPLNTDWKSWSKPTASNPAIQPVEIDEARRTLPEAIFRQEYEAAFLEDGGEVFRSVQRAATAPPLAAPLAGHRYVMGIDFARYEDFTALAVIDADQRVMVALDRFTEATWGLQRARIAGMARRWNAAAILAEANAMGEPNVEALQREGLPVSGFVTTAVSKPPLIEGLVAAIENADLLLLPDPVLLGELASYSYRTSRSGHTVYEAPAGLHDDTVIALALAWKAATAPLPARSRILFGA